MSAISEIVDRDFQFLFKEAGFDVSPDECNDHILVCQSSDIALRIISDRADVFLDVALAPDSRAWIGFYEVLDAARISGISVPGHKAINRPPGIRRTLRLALPSILKYADTIKQRPVDGAT